MNIYHELKVYGPKDLLKQFYDDNKVSVDDIKINPLLYPNEVRLSFEKCISSAIAHILYKKCIHENDRVVDLIEIKKKSATRDDFVKFLWGTVSNASDIVVKKSDDFYTYQFVTKDTSPMIWFYTISRKYINLIFEVHISQKRGIFDNIPIKFAKGDLIDNEDIKEVKDGKGRSNPYFDKFIIYMNEKKIDYKKYMKRIYEKHYEGAEKNIDHIDFEGIVEDFIQKVKLRKVLQEQNQEDYLYEKSRDFVEYILQ
jgi:hypothetical protein